MAKAGDPKSSRRKWQILWTTLVLALFSVFVLRTYLPLRNYFGTGIGNISSMSLSPDGKVLAMEAWNTMNSDLHELALLDVNSGKVKKAALPGMSFDLLWSPDGRFLVVNCGSEKGTLLLDSESGKVIRTLMLKSSWVAFHPDGSLWHLDYDDNTIWRNDLKGGAEQQLMGPCNPVHGLAVSPDGKRVILAWGGWNDVDPILLDATSFGKLDHWIDKGQGHINSMRFSFDGQHFFTSHSDPRTEGHVKVWNVGSGKVEYVISDLDPLNCDFKHIDISRDGRFLSATRKDRSFGIWSLELRRWIWTLPSEGTPQVWNTAVFSGDSRELWTPVQPNLAFIGTRAGALRKWDIERELKVRTNVSAHP